MVKIRTRREAACGSLPQHPISIAMAKEGHVDPSRRWCGEWLVVAAVALAACADATRSERDARTAATSPPSSSLAVYSPSNPQFLDPNGVAADASGNVYVADTLNCTIRKITPAGAVSTLAGSAGSCGRVDATGTAARFDSPMAVAVDTLGNLYVADYGSDSIRKITPAGTVTKLAGGTWGSADGPGSAAQFYSPMGVAVDASGNVYVADTNNYTIRKITSDGVVSTLAGTAGVTGSADGVGAAA